MVLIISNLAQDAASKMVDKFPPGAACLVMASSFYQTIKMGIDVTHFLTSHIYLSPQGSFRLSEVKGVICGVQRFAPQEFYYAKKDDREYISREMNALFIYILSELKCPKLNPPTSNTLTGVNLSEIEWYRIAIKLGIPILPVHVRNGDLISVSIQKDLEFSECTYIGGELIEDVPEVMVEYMKRLSDYFNMPYIRAKFFKDRNDSIYFSSLDTIPDINNTKYQNNLAKYFQKYL